MSKNLKYLIYLCHYRLAVSLWDQVAWVLNWPAGLRSWLIRLWNSWVQSLAEQSVHLYLDIINVSSYLQIMTSSCPVFSEIMCHWTGFDMSDRGTHFVLFFMKHLQGRIQTIQYSREAFNHGTVANSWTW